jgi:hypothetical protein
MPNDLATLKTSLKTALSDPNYVTWSEAELAEILTQNVARLWPRFSYQPDPTTATIALVSGTEYYAVPANIRTISRIERYNGDDEYGSLDGSAWVVSGSIELGTVKLHISPVIADQEGTLRLIGNAAWPLAGVTIGATTTYIPDELANIVLAFSRVEAYRRVVGERGRFSAWLARNQSQNVSVNELLSMVNESESAARRLLGERRSWQAPVPGRQG